MNLMYSIKYICFAVIISGGMYCANIDAQQQSGILQQTRAKLADKNATTKTVGLFYNLMKLSETHMLFGQQDYASDGFGWKDLYGRCDVKEVTGSHPAMYSFDFLHFTNDWRMEHKDTAYQKRLMIQAYNRGNVISFCWHYYNPVTDKSFYDTTIVVKHILPGGSHHNIFKKDLQIIANFANHAKDANGELIPIIFRPWHEFDGQWFWWGKPHCTTDEFKNLYRFTVTYLRDSLKVRNFLYAFSPDCRFKTEEQYLERYPGDEYVDLLGMDNYWDFNPKGDGLEAVVKKCRIISDLAQKKNKLAAITETGLANVTDTTWYTQKLLYIMKSSGVKLAYVAVWRGEYVPHPKHPAAEDFIRFRKDPLVLFEDDIQDIYSIENFKVKK
jgi:mannan endo-1,4-beta-mannosidase